MSLPKISIITPFKNTSSFLTACLDSILIQSYTNWELLVVDDHSTDESYKLVENYAVKDKRIRLMTNKSNGIIAALQTAYQQSQGELITRMDSDDIMTENKLEVLSHLLSKSGKGHVAVGQVTYFSATGISDGYAKYESWLNSLTASGRNFSELYKECPIPSPCWMIHRDDFDRCGGFSPDTYPEDYDLSFRFFEAGFQCIPCSEKLHLWRDYPSRTSRTHEHYAQNYFLDLKFKYFVKLHYDSRRPLVIWGAGFKGKHLARMFLSRSIPFVWMCDNPNKIGRDIYGQKMVNFSAIDDLESPQIIVTVANPEAQDAIDTFLTQRYLAPMIDYFFFC